MAIEFSLNGRPIRATSAPDTPLLWVLRDELQQCGTKFGCGIGQCGACTVHLEGQATRACQLPLQVVAGRAVRSIEGLAATRYRALQEAWIAEATPQCGYCQSGMLMAAAGLLADTPLPSDEQIDTAITNICRCGTYPRVRAAIHRAARALAGQGS